MASAAGDLTRLSDSLYDRQSIHSSKSVPPAYASPVECNRNDTLGSNGYNFHLHNRKGKPWATLSVNSSSRATQTASSLPVFVEGRPITGSFSVDLGSPDPIRAVELIITGQIVTGVRPENRISFLEHRVSLWSSDTATATSASGLSGRHTWPFSVHLPKQVPLCDQSGNSQLHRLPHTLIARNCSVAVNYHIAIKVSRKRFHTDSKLVTMVFFFNATRPDAPSPLRQQAYREQKPLLGPDLDPIGWQTLDMISMCGRIFADREVKIQCSLSLAVPFCYTRGTIIPLFLTLDCDDLQALDLVASPESVNATLHRHIKYTDTGRLSGSKTHWRTESIQCGTAWWWPSAQQENPAKRSLEGEIRLSRYMQPSCDMPFLKITVSDRLFISLIWLLIIGNEQYSITLDPFEATGFHVPVTGSKSLANAPISIATIPAKGPSAAGYAPPMYADTARMMSQKFPVTPHWRTFQQHSLGFMKTL